MIRTWPWPAAVLLALACPAAWAQNAAAPGGVSVAPGSTEPAFAIREKDVTLPTDATILRFDLLVDVTGENLDETAISGVADAATQSASTVTVKDLQPQHVSGTAKQRLWRVSGVASGLAPGQRDQRLLIVRHAGGSQSLPYSIGKAATGEFGWTVLAPAGALKWDAATAIPVRIRVQGPIAATAPSLVAGTLIEKTDLDPLDLQLCGTVRGECGQAGTILPGQTRDLYLRPRNGDALLPGEYTGTLQIAAAQKVQPETTTLTLYVSSWRWKALGLLCIALGVLIAWFVTVAARAALDRRTLQRVAALLRERLQKIEERLAGSFPDPGEVGATRAAVAHAREMIREAEDALPGRLPSPWGADSAAKTEFAKLVAEADARIDVLAVLIDEGLLPLAVMGKANPQVAAEIATVDVLAVSRDTKVDAVRPLVAAAVKRAAAGPLESRFAGSPPPPPSAARLAFEIEMLNGITWVAILTVTILVGALVMLLPNKGFGRWDDFVACLLWGFGLPVAASQLSTLGFGSVKTSLGVTAPS